MKNLKILLVVVTTLSSLTVGANQYFCTTLAKNQAFPVVIALTEGKKGTNSGSAKLIIPFDSANLQCLFTPTENYKDVACVGQLHHVNGELDGVKVQLTLTIADSSAGDIIGKGTITNDRIAKYMNNQTTIICNTKQ